ncbi:hypothetical protein V9T40_004430 [Parthenolecanium corni]|uniref:SET domain-containing protein n=1 Tax=Parthenolecanium corni TaxID=536013 RepID=A0AAN9YAR0_9HEMI
MDFVNFPNLKSRDGPTEADWLFRIQIPVFASREEACSEFLKAHQHLGKMSNDYDGWLSLCSFISGNLIDLERFQKTPHTNKVFDCYSDNRIRNEILRWMETHQSEKQSAGKSLEESKRLRDLGNLKYAKADVKGSLKLYTESIICAPHGSRELFLALGNRSAASFRLRNYKTCFKQAYDTFHKWECRGSRLVLDTGVGFLALRTLLKASQDPFSFHYEQVNNLEMHLDDVPVHDLISFSLTATLLILYLEKYSDFFTSSVRKSIDGVGFRLLKHMFQIVCNAFAAKKSCFKGKLDEDSLETCLETFSTGLYPSAAMMNHSCDPNIITSFRYNTLIVRAGQQIKKGEEIFNCYGPHYRRRETEQRKEILKNQFYFDCKCKQCILAEVETTKFLCLNCASPCIRKDDSKKELKCTKCNAILKEQQYDELLRKAESMQITVSWRYVGERAKRIKFYSGEYSLRYGQFLRHSLASYLMGLVFKMPAHGNLPIADLDRYAEELEEIVLYNFGSWSFEYSYVKNLRNSLVKHYGT